MDRPWRPTDRRVTLRPGKNETRQSRTERGPGSRPAFFHHMQRPIENPRDHRHRRCRVVVETFRIVEEASARIALDTGQYASTEGERWGMHERNGMGHSMSFPF